MDIRRRLLRTRAARTLTSAQRLRLAIAILDTEPAQTPRVRIRVRVVRVTRRWGQGCRSRVWIPMSAPAVRRAAQWERAPTRRAVINVPARRVIARRLQVARAVTLMNAQFLLRVEWVQAP